MKKKLFVSFSGGETSAYMGWWIKEKLSDQYELSFVYANTGEEHEETLSFINKCDKFFKFNLTWIEAVVSDKGTGYKKVDFETASRNGEPFEEVIKKYGIPNMSFPHCNRELKMQPMTKFMDDNNIFCRAIGIRSDEFNRATPDKLLKRFGKDTKALLEYRYFNEGLYYPLILDEPITKDRLNLWWDKMPFRLNLPEHHGNCKGCWKKSDRKIWTIAKNNPEFLEFNARMEEKYGTFIPEGQKESRDEFNVFYRNRRSTKDMIELSKKEFEEFIPNSLNQLDLFCSDVDEDFTCNECGTIF